MNKLYISINLKKRKGKKEKKWGQAPGKADKGKNKQVVYKRIKFTAGIVPYPKPYARGCKIQKNPVERTGKLNRPDMLFLHQD